MTEYEILLLHGETLDTFWNAAQFYASVSFGYIVLSHVAVDRLNWRLIFALSTLYVAFSFWQLNGLNLVAAQVAGHREDLVEIYRAGALRSGAAIAIVESWKPVFANITSTFAAFGIFLSALFYLPYNYLRHKNDNT